MATQALAANGKTARFLLPYFRDPFSMQDIEKKGTTTTANVIRRQGLHYWPPYGST